jgi:excinuclease ABC subunit A
VARLSAALHRLVERGDTVLVIEHNLDLIAAADCVIDLGPEGGDGGGRLVAWGTPEEVARSRQSRTAPFLRELLGGRWPPEKRGRVTPENRSATAGGAE